VTVGEHVAQVQACMLVHGGQVPLYWVAPETGKRYAVLVQVGIGGRGVYLALVPGEPAEEE
jgi:hypothetical protein